MCCKNFDSHFTFQILWLFLCNCLRKMHWPLLCKRISYDMHMYCIHSITEKKKQSKGWLFFLALFYIKMHIKLFLNGEGNRGQSEIPRGTLLFMMLIFYTQKMLILQGDRHLLEQAELFHLLLASAPHRIKSIEIAESSKGALPHIMQNRISS